jgi:serine/threonine-protein kinase
MGEVYRGLDTRLGRAVAIKILPRDRAEHEESRTRFDREAKAVSQLNHQHICTLHDVGEASVDGAPLRYLVMELLEGETLADRISRGPLPVDQAVKFAMQIAAALDCAHRRGIVHRDLKPGNIMITPAGVKLLDFGLAKSLEPATFDSVTPTLQAVTGDDVIVGTLQYMSPEQLTGGAVDARSDIFSLGGVVYEMVTGQRPFTGATQASVIASIIRDEPPRLAQIMPVAPASLERLITMCLQKDPEERWQNARDVLLQLRTILATEPVMAPIAAKRTRALPLLAALAAGIALGALITWLPLRSRTTVTERVRNVTMDIAPGVPLMPNGFGAPFDISPDASQIVWVGSANTSSSLFVRKFDSLETIKLSGTDQASAPFFSPDGQMIGFFAMGVLRVASVRMDSAVRDLVPAGPGAGGTWVDDKTLVYAALPGGGLSRLNLTDGSTAALTNADRSRGEGGHSWPFAIPGTHSVLFTVEREGKPWEEAQIAVIDLDTKRQQIVLAGGTRPRYAAGKMFFTRGNQLFSVPFDAKALKVTGNASLVLDGVVSQPGTGGSFFYVAADGTVVYLRGGPDFFATRVIARAADGKTAYLDVPLRTFANPRLSHDEKQLAVQVVGANDDVWVYHRDRRTFTRVTAQEENLFPNWSPDDREFLVSSFLKEGYPVAVTVPITGGQPKPLAPAIPGVQIGTSWSPSGRIALSVLGEKTGFDVWIVEKNGVSRPLVQTRFTEHLAALSPDGRLVAYVSDESGASEVYLRAVDRPAEKIQVSVSGGSEPLWSRDGRRLYFRDVAGFLAVDITMTGDPPSAGQPQRVFEGTHVISDEGVSFDVTRDGTFILLERNGAPEEGTKLQLRFAR